MILLTPQASLLVKTLTPMMAYLGKSLDLTCDHAVGMCACGNTQEYRFIQSLLIVADRTPCAEQQDVWRYISKHPGKFLLDDHALIWGTGGCPNGIQDNGTHPDWSAIHYRRGLDLSDPVHRYVSGVTPHFPQIDQVWYGLNTEAKDAVDFFYEQHRWRVLGDNYKPFDLTFELKRASLQINNWMRELMVEDEEARRTFELDLAVLQAAVL